MAQKIIGQLPDFPKSFIAPLAYAVAGICSLLYRIITWHSQQRFISTCSGKTIRLGAKLVNPLLEHGKQYGLAPKAAVATELNLQVRGTRSGRLEAGLRLLHAPTRTMYRIVFPVQIQAGETALVRVVAIERPTEADLDFNETLSFVDYSRPVADLVERTAVVLTVARSGTEAETVQDFRNRVLRRARSRPGGGNLADYRVWAESVAGVARAYPYSGLPGWVDLYVEGPNGRPVTADQLDAVEAATKVSPDDATARRPEGSKVRVERVRYASYRVTLQLRGDSDAEPIRSRIESLLRERIGIMEPWILGLDPDDSPRTDILDVQQLLSLAYPLARTRDGESRLVSLTLQRIEGLEPRLTEPLEQIRLAPGQKARLESVVLE